MMQLFFPEAPIQASHPTYPFRSVHSNSLVPLSSHSSQFYHSFFPSTIAAWNSLPPDTASATSLPAFKSALRRL